MIVPAGANLIGNNDTVSTQFPAGTLVGTPAAPLGPQLGPLGNHGGRTTTMFPVFGSLSIDTGVATAGTPSSDQRDRPRPSGPAIDIGAVEVDDGLFFWDGFETGDLSAW